MFIRILVLKLDAVKLWAFCIPTEICDSMIKPLSTSSSVRFTKITFPETTRSLEPTFMISSIQPFVCCKRGSETGRVGNDPRVFWLVPVKRKRFYLLQIWRKLFWWLLAVAPELVANTYHNRFRPQRSCMCEDGSPLHLVCGNPWVTEKGGKSFLCLSKFTAAHWQDVWGRW